MSGAPRRRVAALAVALAGLAATLGACGVEVPDDVADDLRDTTTTAAAPSTTETPSSDDELEQALIDNGYTQAEAACGADNLRAALDEEGIRSIIDAETIEDISGSTARAFAQALRPCVEDGAGAERPDGGFGEVPRPGDDPDGPDGPDDSDDPDQAEGEGDVTRAEFLASLVSAGVDQRTARCVTQRIFAELDQDDINALFRAETEDEIPDDLLDAASEIEQGCSR